VPRTEALVRLYDAVNSHADWLPLSLGALPPLIKPKGIEDVPVLAWTLWSKDVSRVLRSCRRWHTVWRPI
jgi:hypothetical protein